MKRSEINKAIRELEAMCKKYNCYLPPFCDFTPEQWQTKGHEYDEVRECMLGWDILAEYRRHILRQRHESGLQAKGFNRYSVASCLCPAL